MLSCARERCSFCPADSPFPQKESITMRQKSVADVCIVCCWRCISRCVLESDDGVSKSRIDYSALRLLGVGDIYDRITLVNKLLTSEWEIMLKKCWEVDEFDVLKKKNHSHYTLLFIQLKFLKCRLFL